MGSYPRLVTEASDGADTVKQFTLTKQELHTVVVNVGGKPGGNDLDDLRKLREGREALKEFCRDYVDRLDEIAASVREAAEDADDAGELTPERDAAINRQAQRAVRVANETLGAESVDVRIEDAVHQSVKDRWKALSGWKGDEETQDRILRITDALDQAKAVRFDEDAKAWLEAESAPAASKLRDLASARKGKPKAG